MTEDTKLKRSVSLPLIVFYGLGTIIGAGIYVLVGKVAGITGMLAPFSFLLASLLAAFTAFAYAELVARLPRSAGEAVYIQEAFGRRRLSMTVGLAIILIGMVSSATLANGFVGYFQEFVSVPAWLVIVVLIVCLGAISAWGIQESVTAAFVLTLVEIGGLLLVLWVAGPNLVKLPDALPAMTPSLEWPVWESLLLAAFLAFYAFIGFEDMVNVAEEVKQPTRNLPIAIVLALVISTLLYMLISTVAVLSVPPDELAASDAPLALVYTRVTGEAPLAIGIIGMLSVLNGVLIQIIMATRILYGLSRQGWLPEVFGRVNARTHTPLIANTLIVAVILLLALWFPLLTLAKATSFITLFVFAMVNLALWWLKRDGLRVPGIIHVPRWVPGCGFLATCCLLFFQMAKSLA